VGREHGLGAIDIACENPIGEILVRTYFESQDRRIYSVKRVISRAATKE